MKRPFFEYITTGGIHVQPNFFPHDIYEDIKEKIDTLEMNSTYQPADTHYGNRLQAMPCYEGDFNYHQSYITERVEQILDIEIKEYKCFARKIIIEELKQSKCTGKYGFVHKEPAIAGIMHFDQAFDGGTAFFENNWDATPDIYVSAYPNRFLIYNGNRWHAPAFDYTFKERTSLAFFFGI